MSQVRDFFSQVGGSVQDGDAIATALFMIEMFFMLAWLVSPSASPLPGVFGATQANYNVVSAFFPLLIVIIPITIFGLLKNMFQRKEAVTREAFSLTPKMLVRVQSIAGSFSTRQESKRQFYKKYGRATRYRRAEPKEESE